MKTANIVLELQHTIPAPPQALSEMYSTACKADDVTMQVWEEKWIANITANKKRFGSFAGHDIGKLWGKWAGKPAIIAGAGPSLRKNVQYLKDRPESVCLVSCLHNFHYMEDNGARPDYYVSLDAGPITIEEVSEGGGKNPDEYWDMTKDRTLIAYIGSDPILIEKWQGEILFYNAPIPSERIKQRIDAIEPFHQWVSNGGNVLGACMYVAKGFLGSPVSIFVGADFSFSNEHLIKFHAWDSKYDSNMGQVLKTVDIYGNSIKTWGSYWGFKVWFDYVAYTCPGIYINATEGGIFGAYREGNIAKVWQMDLLEAYKMFMVHENTKYQSANPLGNEPGNNLILF
jgi:hypothetical protein